MPCFNRSRRRVGREEFNIEGVEIICGSLVSISAVSTARGLTNWNHALAVVVQVLHQHLAQRINLPRILLREIFRQELTLLLQPPHEIRQLLNHTLVRAEVTIFCKNYAEVEYKLIAVICGASQANRISEDSVAIVADLKEVAAELLSRYHERRDVGECEEGGLGGIGRWYDGSFGNLVNYLRA